MSRVDLILQQLEELPTLPSVALRVLEATSTDTANTKQVVQLIESDPALTARILQLVHRADSGVRGQVTTLQRAVVLLGFDAVRSAVLAVSVFHAFDSQPRHPASGFSREEFWKHCLAVAVCAELLAEAIGSPAGKANSVDPAEAFVCGLLHDLGKVALDAVLPKSFAKVVEAAELLRCDIADVERQVIGLDHLVAGKRLAERWQLPPAIRDCVWLHGQVPQALPATVRQPRLVNCITLADMLVRQQHLGYSGNHAYPIALSTLLDAVGLTQADIAGVQQKLVARIEPRAAALGLGQSSSGELYQQALAQANKELGKISGQLAAKNRRLTIRARFFDALSQFQAELRPDIPAAAVLKAIAQTARDVLDTGCVATFSLPPGQDFAQTLICGNDGEIISNAIVDLPGMTRETVGHPNAPAPSEVVPEANGVDPEDGTSAIAARPTCSRPAHPALGDGPVLPVGADMEWLVATLSPRLPHDRRYWICLQADGVCIGGVVWGAVEGEAQRLSPQAQELLVIGNAWGLALRTAQVREEAKTLAEQLAESNRQLQAAQEQILRSKAMLSVGEMAAGAAHEMNNPLAVISGRSQLLATELADPKHKAMSHLIHEQSHRLSAIITELMDFARPEAPHIASCEVAEVIERAVYEAKMHTDPADRAMEVTMGEVPAVMVDARQVSAALVEVIDNAIAATDARQGHIAIHAGYDTCSARVVITIADDGCGMDEATVKRAFDPFFSNKPAGRRRGMGLAKALRWIESSGGSIQLQSRPGQGTRSIILLPAVVERESVLPAPPRRAAL